MTPLSRWDYSHNYAIDHYQIGCDGASWLCRFEVCGIGIYRSGLVVYEVQ